MSKRDHIWFGLAWLLCIVFVNPVGEFPLNDDWGYALVVKQLVESGSYQPGTWPVMTLFTQVLWGGLFAAVFGFSFTILRISTLVLAMAGSYWVFRECMLLSKDRLWSWMALATLALNPLYFHLSFTFMTDVPFAVGVIGAMVLYRRAMETNNGWYWAAAGLATVAATLVRQPGLLLSVAFGIAYFLQRFDWRSAGWALLVIGLTYGALLMYVHFGGLAGETPGDFNSLKPLLRRLRFPLIGELFLKRGGAMLFYVSIFMFPLLLLRMGARKQFLSSRPAIIASGLAGIATCVFAFVAWREIPVGNILDFFGVGPTPMVGRDSRYIDVGFLPGILWPLFRLVGWVLVFLFLRFWVSRLPSIASWRHWSAPAFWKLGLLFFILAYGLFLLLEKVHYDRYYLALFPAVIFLLMPSRPDRYERWKRMIAVGFIVLMGLFSIGATQDNLRWNRTRWSVLDAMVREEGIAPRQIDGGLEFNGWFGPAPQGPFSFEHKSWWFVDEDNYVLSLSRDLPCSEQTTAYPVGGWWPGRDTVYVHQRPLPVQRDTIFSDLEQVSSDSNLLSTNRTEYSLTDAAQRVTDRAHSGRYAFFLTPERPYAGKVTLAPVQPCEAITITAWRLGPDRSAGIVAAAPNVDDFHSFQHIFTELPEPNGWHRIRHEIRLPADYPSDQLDIYLWNPVIDSIWMDDVRVIWRRRR